MQGYRATIIFYDSQAGEIVMIISLTDPTGTRNMDMALNFLRSILVFSFLALFLGRFLPVENARALSESLQPGDLPPDLLTFVGQVRNGQAGELRGLYVPELFAAPVVQQPAGDHEFVSPRHNILTQFGLASRYGSTGLLAHNYLAGEKFSLLQENHILRLVYGDGEIATFVVVEVLEYQALEPESTSSRFVSLHDSALLTTAELFSDVYHKPGTVVLQTCISKGNEPNWGRLFIIAEPYAVTP